MKKLKSISMICFCCMCLIMLFKSIIFGVIVSMEAGNLAKFIDVRVIFAYIGFISIVLLPMFIIKGKGQAIYLIGVDFIFSVYLVLQIKYFIETGYFAGISTFVLPYMYEPIEMVNLKFSIMDLLWGIDMLIIIIGAIYINKKTIHVNLRKNIGALIGILIFSIVSIFGTHLVVDRNLPPDGIGFFRNAYHSVISIKSMSPIGYLFYDAKMVLKANSSNKSLEDEKKISEWMKWNEETLPDNEYKGLLKDKNLIFIQVESLENIVINQKVEDQEITPNINKLANEGLYFNNIYEQNYGGNTADCDFMSNTSILPLQETVSFLSHPYKQYNSLPKILEKQGYETVAAHAEAASDFYWKQNYYTLGFNKIYDKDDLDLKEMVGSYHSDKEFFQKYSEKLKDVKEPFYSMTTTITSHGPFYMPEEYKGLELSNELNKNRLGEYFQAVNYTDKQIGLYLQQLENMGVLDNSIVVIFGDHCGPHKYYPDLIKDAPIEGDWWKEDKYQVPFIVYSKGLEPGIIEKNGGQIDIMPTVLYLLGIDEKNMMGRNLLNTNRNSTVYVKKRNDVADIEIVGDTLDDIDRGKLEDAYNISNIIIDK